MNQIKIYDVAGAAGVSLATVSRVLNHPEKVKPATKEKIERIIKELGYKPNLNAKGLASSKSTTVAVVVPRLNRSSVAEMVNGIADCATRRGYLLRLFINDSSPTDEEALALEKETLGNVMASGVDGVLYVNDEITRGSFDLLANLNIPVVLTNTNGAEKGLPYVTIDYRAAAYDVTKQMIEKGSKEIWFVTTKRKYIVNELKIEGYTQAMTEAGLEPKIYRAHGTTEINEGEFRNMLNSSHPDVAIVVRDSMAVSFMNIVTEKGLSIPNDVQVIGFQDTRYAELSRPKLTCVETPIYDIGDKAMDLLTELMESTEEVETSALSKIIDYKIIWRDSAK